MFIKHIIKSKGSPLKVKYHSYKVEFAMRGAAHVHGVLWIDWENIDILSKKDTQLIKDALKKIKNEQKLEVNERNAIAAFADKFISCTLKDPKTADIVKSVNVHNHTRTCKKYGSDCRFYFPRFPTLRTIVSVPLQHSDIPEDKHECESREAKRILSSVKEVLQDEQAMEEICELNKGQIGEYIQTLNLVQKIGLILSETPKKKQMVCLEEKNILKHLYSVSDEVNMIDVDKRELNEKMDDLETELDEFDINSLLRERLLALLRKAKFSTGSDEEILTSYEKALGISLQGYRVIHKRDVDEININNYNPEWIHSWNGNMDIYIYALTFSLS